jgi:glycerol-3-phosphate acyltransferase PlsX
MASPEAHITLAVDLMGGDKGPQEVLSGLLKSTSFAPRDLKYLLFGPENELTSLLGDNSDWRSIPHEIRHAPEVVGMDEKPIAGIKNKKNSSMALALQALKDKEAEAMLCCGNTGCLMAGGTIRLRTLEGVERPALCTIWPGRERYFTLLDAGANPHPKPFHIVQMPFSVQIMRGLPWV